MAGCCDPRGCDRVFTDRFARRTANAYRRRGLRRSARRVVAAAAAQGLAGATVLEVGGGVGAIHLELLKRGAARATNLELSPAYEKEAQRLLAEAGLSGLVERRILDIATHPEQVAPADVVVLHRVVCCYPDYAALLAAVGEHARRRVVFSHPPRNLVSRAFLGAENLMLRLQGSEFRIFAHPPAAMRAVLAEHGLRPEGSPRGRVWQVEVAAR